MVFSFGSGLARGQKDRHGKNGMDYTMSLGGHWAVHVCFGGSLARVVQHHQQHPHTRCGGGRRSRCLDWALNSGHGVLHGAVKTDVLHRSTRCLPSFLPVLPLRFDLCQHQPIAKDLLKSKLLCGALTAQQWKWSFPKFAKFFLMFCFPVL